MSACPTRRPPKRTCRPSPPPTSTCRSSCSPTADRSRSTGTPHRRAHGDPRRGRARHRADRADRAPRRRRVGLRGRRRGGRRGRARGRRVAGAPGADAEPRLVAEGEEPPDRVLPLRLVEMPAGGARAVLRRHQQPAAVVRPAPAARPEVQPVDRPRRARRVRGRLRRRQPDGRRRRRRAGREGRRAGRRPAARLPLLPRRRARARALPGRADQPLRAHPVARSGQLEGAAARHARAAAARPARLRRRRLPHPYRRAQLPALLPGAARPARRHPRHAR